MNNYVKTINYDYNDDNNNLINKLINNILIYLCINRLISIDIKFEERTIEEYINKNYEFNIIGIHQAKLNIIADKVKKDEKNANYGNCNVNQTKNKNKRKLIIENKETSKKLKDYIENLLFKPTAIEKEKRKLNDEINDLLSISTAKEKMLMEKYKSDGNQVQEFCQYGTKEECFKVKCLSKIQIKDKCSKIHFKRIIKTHTDVSLGDCSFLNTCFHMDTCKYIHYEIDSQDLTRKNVPIHLEPIVKRVSKTNVIQPQWVQADLRKFDMSVLGKFSVIMADPPWDIHMELPYGTMADDEMRKLNIPCLQDEGYIFLWVTGRAMELGRECLKIWGYERCDELIWVKTNQLQRIIRTGRTGHWLNHGKEHCLIGVKGNPTNNFNKGLDCDIIVSEVRATSHKPDEIYGIIERLSPGTRKVELFGRPHNVQPNWVTLGNELDGVRLLEPEIVKKFKEKYTDGKIVGQNNSIKEQQIILNNNPIIPISSNFDSNSNNNNIIIPSSLSSGNANVVHINNNNNNNNNINDSANSDNS